MKTPRRWPAASLLIKIAVSPSLTCEKIKLAVIWILSGSAVKVG